MGSESMPMRCTGRWCPGNHNSSNSSGSMAGRAKHHGAPSVLSSARALARRSTDRSSSSRYYDSSARQSLQGSPRRSFEGNPWS